MKNLDLFKSLSLTTIILSLSILPSHALAGTRDGGGGNSVICIDKSGVKSVELLDYYEVRLNGGKTNFNSSLGNYQAILSDLLSKWKAIAPERMTLYQNWLSSFSAESGIFPGIEIPAIQDTGTVAIPDGCVLQPIAFQRPDEEILPGVKRYTINKDIWDSMSEVQKAGLVLHELIYREGIKAGHTTSFPTRYFNGFLASTTPKAETYISIVSLLPLKWAEFGGGLTVKLGEDQDTAPFKIFLPFTPDGYLDDSNYNTLNFNNIQNVTSNIDTENLKISVRETGTVSGGKFEFYKWGFLNLEGDSFSFDQIYTKFTTGVVGFVNPFSGQLLKVEINMQGTNIFIKLATKDSQQPTELVLDPNLSWFQSSSGLIKGITKIQRTKINIEDYGPGSLTTLTFAGDVTTASGEVWKCPGFPHACVYEKP